MTPLGSETYNSDSAHTKPIRKHCEGERRHACTEWHYCDCTERELVTENETTYYTTYSTVLVIDISRRQQEACARLQHVNSTSVHSICLMDPCRKLPWGSASDMTATLDGFQWHDALQGSTTAFSWSFARAFRLDGAQECPGCPGFVLRMPGPGFITPSPGPGIGPGSPDNGPRFAWAARTPGQNCPGGSTLSW
jgi:hypothetical protein